MTLSDLCIARGDNLYSYLTICKFNVARPLNEKVNRMIIAYNNTYHTSSYSHTGMTILHTYFLSFLVFIHTTHSTTDALTTETTTALTTPTIVLTAESYKGIKTWNIKHNHVCYRVTTKWANAIIDKINHSYPIDWEGQSQWQSARECLWRKRSILIMGKKKNVLVHESRRTWSVQFKISASCMCQTRSRNAKESSPM